MLFKDELFVQMTPGEVSRDQAVRNFFYTDETMYVNDGLAANFWSPAWESLDVGSLITVRGILGKQGTLPFPHPHTFTQTTFQVWKKDLNPPGHRDKYRIWVIIGPNTSYVNVPFPGSNPPPPPSSVYNAHDLNTEISVCKYRGFVMRENFSGLATPVQWNMNIGGSRFHLSKGDYCWGQLITGAHNVSVSDHVVVGVVPAPTTGVPPNEVEHPDEIDIYFSGGAGPLPVETDVGSGVWFPFWVRVEVHEIKINT